MTGVGSSPALATCETSHVLLAGVPGGFPGALPFCPTYLLARLDMSDIILKGTLNKKQTNKKKTVYSHKAARRVRAWVWKVADIPITDILVYRYTL